MPQDDLVYVGHLLDVARQIAAKVAGLDRSSLNADDTLRPVATHLMQTMGEAARLVGNDFKSVHSNVPCHQIMGMRRRIVHDYLNVDFDVVWQVVQTDPAPLITPLEPLVDDQPEET